MATYSRRERVTRYVEYTVPVDLAWGACWVEVEKAMVSAASEYRTAHRLPDDASLSDDAIRFFPGDEEIIIRFETKE